MYCTKSMTKAIKLIKSLGLTIYTADFYKDKVRGYYKHPRLYLDFLSPDAPIFEHAIGVEWDTNSGKFTVYSTIKESIGGIVDGKQLIRYTTDMHKGWIAESYEDMADGIKALGENLRYKIEREYNSDIESTLSVLD